MKERLYNSQPESDAVLVSSMNQLFKLWCERFLAADLYGFMDHFQLNITNEYYLKRWFSGYMQKVESPVKVEFEQEEINKIDDNRYNCLVIFNLTYALHKEEEVCFELKFRMENDQIRFTSVNINQLNRKWILDDSLSVVDDVIGRAMEPITSTNGHFTQGNEVKKVYDPERAALYARAALKSVRYRNTHPEIDCAAILSNMMSYRVAELAYQCKGVDEETVVKRVNYFLKKVFDAKTYEELKEDDNSYFPARELSLLALSDYDEMIYNTIRLNNNELSCVDLCSFYIAVLRLAGFRAEQAFLITQPFHYLAAVKLKDKFLIISLNEVIAMKSNSLYGDTDLERIITPVQYAQNAGESNMTAKFLEQMKAVLKNEIPVFTEMIITESLNEVPVEAESFPIASNYASAMELHNEMLQYVYDQSMKYPGSPFTWSKYAYQTLTVDKPQAYVIASINSVELKHFLKKYNSLLAVMTWLKELCNTESIYLEEDRIMTSGQVIRNCTGGHKDRAIFIYAALKGLNLFEKGLLCINSKSSYVIYRELKSGNKIIINSLDCGIYTQMPEDNQIIMNEKKYLAKRT